MPCPHCEGAQKIFSDRTARKDLRRYQRKGPNKHTRILLELLPEDALRGATLVDIGGGIGAIQHEAMARGARSVTDVDASAAYLETARRHGRTLGYAERANYVHEDFTEVAHTLAPADLVTLDRVVCCYPDVGKLLGEAAKKSRKFVGLVYPQDRWWARLFAALGNAFLRLLRNPFRMYIHPDSVVEGILLREGFRRKDKRSAGFWQVRLYERSAAA